MKIHFARENLVKYQRRIWIAPVDNFVFRLPARLPSNSFVSLYLSSSYVHAHTRLLSFLYDRAAYRNARRGTVHRRWLHVAYEATNVCTCPQTGWIHVSKGPFKSVFAASSRLPSRQTWNRREGRNKGMPRVSSVSAVFSCFPTWGKRRFVQRNSELRLEPFQIKKKKNKNYSASENQANKRKNARNLHRSMRLSTFSGQKWKKK